jgi:hypothetical protein
MKQAGRSKAGTLANGPDQPQAVESLKMTFQSIPSNPFDGDSGIRIEKAVRRAADAGHAISVGDVLISLRTDPNLSNDDFRTFFRALLEPRSCFAAEAWVAFLIHGEVHHA